MYKLDNGHTYVTDESGRVMNVGGNLGGVKLDRNTYQQRCVGQSECSTGYDGGHLIASHLGGAGDKINLVPMTRDLNRIDYRAMERELGAALDAGSSVSVKIDVIYPSVGVVTPNQFKVTAWVDGNKQSWTFDQ
ncbi:MAG TPA: DNA/RNA non-specific endonuclease [Cellvibrio sp.]